MKKHIKFLFNILIIFYTVNASAINTADSSGSYDLCQNINPGSFALQNEWLNLDSNISYVSSDNIFYYNSESDEIELDLASSYFDLFNYIPSTKAQLLLNDSNNKIIIKSESQAVIQIEYIDAYANVIKDGFPKFYYRLKNSSGTFSEIAMNAISASVFNSAMDPEYGEYEYYCEATNDYYPGIYKTPLQTFVVTERPHSFINLNINTQNDNANPNTGISFSWSVSKGVPSDILSYVFCIGTDATNMTETNLNISNNYVISDLQSRTRYYWKVKVSNQYGVQLLSPGIFSFITLGTISRVYNAPNPFNPQKGENTRIFFEMPENGSAQIDIYSEYGDRIRTISQSGLLQGSNEIVYDGKDDNGRVLYNGTYLCVLKKKYSGQTKTEKCRLLIIK